MVGFEILRLRLRMTGFVLRMTGFVLRMTGFVLRMTGACRSEGVSFTAFEDKLRTTEESQRWN